MDHFDVCGGQLVPLRFGRLGDGLWEVDLGGEEGESRGLLGGVLHQPLNGADLGLDVTRELRPEGGRRQVFYNLGRKNSSEGTIFKL